jgi:hypothetical protein
MSFWKEIRDPDLKDFFRKLFGNVDTADGTIAANRLVKIDSSGNLVEGTIDSQAVIGVNGEGVSKLANATIEIISYGRVDVVSAAPITAGDKLKCADNGRVITMNTSGKAAVTIDTATGEDGANQPANDGVELVSADAADTTQTATVIGITGETVTTEDIALDGTTPVSTTKTDWDEILAVKVDAVTAGDVTIREASGDQTICTITAGNLNVGVTAVPAADQSANGVAPTVVADGATTKMVGIQYTNTSGAVAYQADQLAGTVAQTFGTAALLVTEIYGVDLESARTITVKTGAEEDENNCVGKALAAASAADTTFKALLTL